jgi:hypothetical protein
MTAQLLKALDAEEKRFSLPQVLNYQQIADAG